MLSLKKVCKSVRFFAQVQEMTFPDWQSGAVTEPDWGVGMQVSGIGFFDIESFVSRSRDILFLHHQDRLADWNR